jgi:hypothetical protein
VVQSRLNNIHSVIPSIWLKSSLKFFEALLIEYEPLYRSVFLPMTDPGWETAISNPIDTPKDLINDISDIVKSGSTITVFWT